MTRTRTNARVLAVALALAAAALAGCGSTDSGDRPDRADNAATSKPPTDASTQAFCQAALTLATASQGSDWGAAQDAARAWLKLGTPSDISAAQRAGVERGLNLIMVSKDDADLQKRVDALNRKQRAEVDSVEAYLAKACRTDGGGAGDGSG